MVAHRAGRIKEGPAGLQKHALGAQPFGQNLGVHRLGLGRFGGLLQQVGKRGGALAGLLVGRLAAHLRAVGRRSDSPDAESIALFRAEGRTVSVTNVWRVEVTPAGSAQPRFAYQLLRQPPNARNFRVEFDLTTPIEPPPAPWGADG